MAWVMLFAAIFIALWVLASLRRTTKPDERLLVYHHGKFNRVAGPGLCFVIFPEEEAIAISLDQYLPAWRALPPPAIHKEFQRLASDGKLPPAPHPEPSLTLTQKHRK